MEGLLLISFRCVDRLKGFKIRDYWGKGCFALSAAELDVAYATQSRFSWNTINSFHLQFFAAQTLLLLLLLLHAVVVAAAAVLVLLLLAAVVVAAEVASTGYNFASIASCQIHQNIIVFPSKLTS